jgi:hypothetical protein
LASIFFSWSSDDRTTALRLRDRLRDVGLEVWEYTDGLPAGGNIYAKVIEAIEKSSVAVLCFSDQTWNREWITQEASWAFQAHT